VALVGGLLLAWFYGSGLSEETSYKLADEYAQTYAKRNRLDLNLYTPPTVGAQRGKRLYEFSWTSKQGGKPLTIVVDSMNVEVQAVESPLYPPQNK
jgi:NADPH-dependent 7-cyano-7-deazaguanine reductase QueF-like protein